MSSEKIKIGIFASTQSIINRMEILTPDAEDHIRLETKSLEEAIPVAIEMERIGFEVIIGRRGTANLLRENLRIPVLSFPHRSLDILESLVTAAKISRQVFLTVFRHRIEGLSIVEDLLHIRLLQGIYHDRESMRRAMWQAKREGFEIAVGGIVTEELAAEIGLQFVEIRTSDDDIGATIENAKSVALSAREEKAVTRFYRSIIDATSEGVIAVDKNGAINILNSTAKNWLNADDRDIMGKEIIKIIPGCQVPQALRTKTPIYDRIAKIRQDSFLFNYHPVIMNEKSIGVVTTFRNIEQVIRSEHVVRRSFSKGFVSKYTLDELVYASPAMSREVNVARRYAKTDSTILIIGETGTGKEIFAHGIHHLSMRSRHPFVSINCAAIPEQLLESELFGYEEGSFTGSKKGGKPGLFEIAHQGSIFLDEVDSLSPSVQLKLLRVLQEREVMRIGASRKIPVDVRIIASSASDLSAAVGRKTFREDLFFRLNILRIHIPPLRQRPEDIPLLLDFFIGAFSKFHRLATIKLPKKYLKILCDYSWPGNVRQIRNFAERLIMNFGIFNNINVIEPLLSELRQYPGQKADMLKQPDRLLPLRKQVKEQIAVNEKTAIVSALETARYSKAVAAKNLGISRSTLWRKIRQLGIES